MRKVLGGGRFFISLLILGVAACAPMAPIKPVPPPPEAPVVDKATFSQVALEDVPGFFEDDLEAALPALKHSCARISTWPAERELGPGGLAGKAADWASVCDQIKNMDGQRGRLRTFIERNFVAFEVGNNGDSEGLFTGYYESELEGSREPLPAPGVALYELPDDVVKLNLGDFDPALSGRRIFGRVQGQSFVPYHDREKIDGEKVLAGRGLELLWAADPVDAFFLHIQGSGRVRLPDGTYVRVGFAGSNGRPFTGIGRYMLDEGLVSGSDASAQGIRAWLKAHPQQAAEIMRLNQRYIFFREIDGDGPIGALSVPLTAGRSLAVDPAYLPLGVPIFLDTTWPVSNEPLRRLVVAQDTGSAIKGPVRGDLFWGFGEEALKIAGRMKQRGRYYLLLPRSVGQRLLIATS